MTPISMNDGKLKAELMGHEKHAPVAACVATDHEDNVLSRRISLAAN